MSLVQLTVKGISYSQTQNGAYALILNEIAGERKLPIVIGAFEAQAIAIAMEKNIQPPRPLTHDLFKNFANRFEITIREVIIHKLVDGVFYSSIVCYQNGKEEIIDARTSDAVALAMRFNAPIYTYRNILDKAGIYLTISPPKRSQDGVLMNPNFIQPNESNASGDFYSKKPTAELYDLLDVAVNDEDYEKAAKIRDELSKR